MRDETTHRMIEAFFVTVAMLVTLVVSTVVVLGIALFCKMMEGS